MAAASTDSLVDALRQLRLLDSGQLAEVDLDLAPRFPEPKALAKELIRRDWLTPYQANQLLQGRGQELVLGSYILLERLGEGAMGQVFKARHRNLGRVCALKRIRKERLESPNAVKRFEREVRAAAALSHPNIVLAYDADEIEGTHLLVMEYVERGTDLARLVKEKGPLAVARACEYVRQAALGLQHAHERGMVHRDVKPHNLMLSADGAVVKILDMGIARLEGPSAADDQSSTMTQTGAVMGTPDYLSPEQATNSHTADIRADIYSLGCTFYFLLAGNVPFPGGALGYKLVRHRMEEPAPLEKLRPGVPPWTAQVVRKMMAKKPEDRFQTPAEVAAALASGLATGAVPSLVIASEDRTLAAAVVPAAADTLDPSSSDAGRAGDTETSAPHRFRRKAPSRPWLLYAAMGAVSVGVGVVVLFFLLFHLPGPAKPVQANPDGSEVVVPPPPPLPDEEPPPNPQPTRLPPVIFQDFESGTYGDWKKTGTAFGDRPAAGTLPSQNPVTGYGGKYLVNTFFNGDGSTGTLTSPDFTIKHSYIRFRIGGGAFAGRTCMNLLVGGAAVRTATGKGAERLEWTYWDVKAFKGRTAIIQIVDQATGPWGHVNVDDILFTDELPR